MQDWNLASWMRISKTCVSAPLGMLKKGKRNLVFHMSVVMISSCTDDDSACVHSFG